MLGWMENKPESLPESRKVYEVESFDGSLVLSVWDDSRLTEQYPSDEEPHGLLTIYDSVSRSYYYRERVYLSKSVMSGNDPTDDDKLPWLEKLLKVSSE